MKLTILLALIFGGLCGDDADKMGGFFSLGEAEKMAEEIAVEGGEMAVEDPYIASSPEYTPTSPEPLSVVLGDACGEETLPEPMVLRDGKALLLRRNPNHQPEPTINHINH